MAGEFIKELVKEATGEIAGLFTASRLGWFGKVAGKVISNPTVQEKVAKKVGNFVGIDESGKDLEEEIVTETLLNNLDANKRKEVEKFVATLRDEQDRGKEKATAFRVYIASGLKAGAKRISKSIPNPTGKGKAGQETYEQLDIEWGKNFIDRFLEHQTFEDKLSFLYHQGVFSTMKNKKTPNPAIEKGKDFGKRVGKKIAENQKTNFADLSSKSDSFRANATQRLRDAIDRRKS